MFKTAKTTTKNIKENGPDVLNKVWVLVVTFTLLVAAFVIYKYTAGSIDQTIRFYLTAALGVLAIMFLFTNLRSIKKS